MQSELPKPLFVVNGKPMVQWVIDALSVSSVATQPIIVTGLWTTAIEDTLGPEYCYAKQEVVNGTATAVAAALPHLDTTATADPILVLYADHPFITAASIRTIADTFQRVRPTIAMYTVTVPDFEAWRAPFASFGKIVRTADGKVAKIVEVKNAAESERTLTEVNPALYCFDAEWLAATLPQVRPNPQTGEYYLTDLLELATLEDRLVVTVALPPEEALGINSKEDAAHAFRAQQKE